MRRERSYQPRSRFAVVLLFFLAVCIAFLYVWERVSAVELTIRIEGLKEEVLRVENDVKKLKIRKSQLSSHKRIEEIAREELGLKHPAAHEIIVVMPDRRCVRLTERGDAQRKD